MRTVSLRLVPLLVALALSACALTGTEGGTGGAAGWGAPPPRGWTPPPSEAGATPQTADAPDYYPERPPERPSEGTEAEPGTLPMPPPSAWGIPASGGGRTAPPSRAAARAPAEGSVAAAEAVAAEVTRVSFAERSDGRGFVVRLHTTGRVPAYREELGEGVVRLHLFQTAPRRGLQRGEPRGPVRRYTVETFGTRTTLTLELDPSVPLEARAYPDRDSDDLLLGLTYARPAPLPVASAARPVDDASAERWRLDCIVIDPGHGGKDPGAENRRVGVREKDVTLGIALRLGRMVEQELGIRVVYTRRDDRFVELAERGRIANQSCGKLFVSIHANSAPNPNAQGTETYFLGPARTESARRVMERENSVVQLESDPSLYAGMDDAALILQTMALSTYLRASEQLATLIERQFAAHAGRTSRGVKQAGFLVLWRASMPAVLVEVGFISNDEEARFLASAHGQETIARSILRALREYKVQYERSLGIASYTYE